MINPDDFANKYTAIYRCPDDINNLKIRVALREAKSVDFSEIESDTIETKVFSWQQKVYGKFEREFYKDEKNCVTDSEKKCHEDVARLIDNNDSVIFSYTHEDQVTIPEEPYLSQTTNISRLAKRISELKLTNKEHKQENNEKTHEFDFEQCLLTSLQQTFTVSFFENMHIVADLGEYVDDTWLKQEYILCSLKYDKDRNVLFMCPDFSQSIPYLLEVQSDCTKNYCYFIENASNPMPTDLSLKENQILNKLISDKSKLNAELVGDDFRTPQKNKLWVFFFCEICSAANFEYDNIYVQYFVDLPVNWSCENPNTLKGMSQTSKVSGDENLAHFGFNFEFILECDSQDICKAKLSQAPYIYFEVISKDSWNRYRSEGVAYQHLSVTRAGSFDYSLQCVRLYSQKPLQNLKRFFVGDYSSYDDLTWFGIPRNHQEPVINKYGVNTIATGQLNIRMNVVHQSAALIKDNATDATKKCQKYISEKLSTSDLLKSVEEVLRVYKRARKNMIEARRMVQ